MPPSTPIRRLYEHLASAKRHRALRCDNSSRLERKCRHQLQSVSIWRRDSIGVEQSGFDDSLADIARENEWENGHHESAEISCVAVEDTLTSPEEKSQDGEDYFIRELSPLDSHSRRTRRTTMIFLLANPHSPTTTLIMIPVLRCNAISSPLLCDRFQGLS
jgi:hypothetical protein